jgi:hypothetical protein
MVSYDFTIHINLPRRVDYTLALPVLLYRKLRDGYIFRRIPLTQGQYAIVDADDYYRLIKYKWQVVRIRDTYYVRRLVSRNGKRTTLFMHKVILHAPKGMVVDHINGNPLDNRKANLRLATPAQNSRNRRVTKRGTSIYKGVWYNRTKRLYCARITVSRKMIYIGQFKDEVEAARAYDRAARKYHGEFARLNFPEK